MDQSLTHPGRAGALNGLRFSVWLTVMYFASVFSASAPLLGLLSTVIMVCVPVLLWRMLTTDYRTTGGKWTIGQLWLDGFIAIMCGAVVAGTLLLVYLRWINPGYIYDQWASGIAAFEASGDPAMEQLASDMQTAVENGFSISPSMLTMSLLWLAAFSGSVISLIVAAIVRATKIPAKTSES